MKLVCKYMAIFFTFSSTSNHLHLLQVENCDSNSRFVVDGDDNVKSGLKGLSNKLQSTLRSFRSLINIQYCGLAYNHVHKGCLKPHSFYFISSVSFALLPEKKHYASLYYNIQYIIIIIIIIYNVYI